MKLQNLHAEIKYEKNNLDVMTTPSVAHTDVGTINTILGFYIRLAHGTVYCHFMETFSDLDLTQKQVSALWLAADHLYIAQVNLAQMLGMDRATIMTIINRMEVLGVCRKCQRSHNTQKT